MKIPSLPSHPHVSPLSWAACVGFLLIAGTPTAGVEIHIRPIGVFQHQTVADRGAEIVAYDAASQRLFVTNGACSTLDIVHIGDARAPRLEQQLPIDGDPTHVACYQGLVAVAVAARTATDAGLVLFFGTDGQSRGSVRVDPLPDMLIFTSDGKRLLVANEGEPSADYQVDPEGAVTIIDLAHAPAGGDLSASTTIRASFASMDPPGRDVRVDGPGASPAQDYEPEYIGLSPQDDFALVTLQENNAFARLDLTTGRFTEMIPLGYKRYAASGLDASDMDQGIQIKPWPVLGLYQPDGTSAFETPQGVFFITANEGDVRSYGAFKDARRVSTLTLDPQQFPDADRLQRDDALGRLLVSQVDADLDGDGDADQLVTFGARSFAIWDAHGRLVYDSGDQLEQYIAEHLPHVFNSQHDASSFDSRSDDRGPEPEGVAVGRLGDRTLAFVGLERVSGIALIDVTNAISPQLCSIFHGSTVDDAPCPHPRHDQAPEGLVFIPTADSPTGKPLLVVAFEVSGTVRLYDVLVGD